MYTKILVLADGSERSECVLPYVEWFMKVSKVNEVVFLRVVEPLTIPRGMETALIPEDKERVQEDAGKLALEYLDGIAGRFKIRKIKVRPKILMGKPAKVIADYVAKSDVDLIIMATHGYSGIHRWVRGSKADEIVHAAMVPVFLVKPEDKPP